LSGSELDLCEARGRVGERTKEKEAVSKRRKGEEEKRKRRKDATTYIPLLVIVNDDLDGSGEGVLGDVDGVRRAPTTGPA